MYVPLNICTWIECTVKNVYVESTEISWLGIKWNKAFLHLHASKYIEDRNANHGLDLIWAPIKDAPVLLVWFPISSGSHLLTRIWLGFTWLSNKAQALQRDEQPVPVTDNSVRAVETQRHPTALSELLMPMWHAVSEKRWPWMLVGDDPTPPLIYFSPFQYLHKGG